MDKLLHKIENHISKCSESGNLTEKVELSYKELLNLRRLLRVSCMNIKLVKGDNKDLEKFYNEHY